MICRIGEPSRCGRCISGYVRDPVSGKRAAARLLYRRQPAAARRRADAKGVMDFVPTIAILTAAASLGCWLSYVQGRWLGNTQTVKGWLAHLPHKYHQRATCMFDRHGLLALLAGRFLAFVRTLLPTMAGISGLPNRRFQFFNWLSALLWVCVVTGLGYALSMIPFVKRHEDQVMTCLMILPIALLLAGLLGTLFVVIKEILQRLTLTCRGPAPARPTFPGITSPIVRIRAASSPASNQ